MLHAKEVRVRAVAGRMHPYPGQPGRFIGRAAPVVAPGEWPPVWPALDDGEVIRMTPEIAHEIQRAIDAGDLEYVEHVAHPHINHAPGPKPRQPAASQE